MDLRRQFDLLEEDAKFLDEYGLPWEAVVDGSHWVLVHDFPAPKGYNHDKVTAAIRIEAGYPDAGLDMVYFNPSLQRIDGQPINATNVTQTIGGTDYQRWSRHRTAENPWMPGEDNLGSHLFLVEDWLCREFEKCPLR